MIDPKTGQMVEQYGVTNIPYDQPTTRKYEDKVNLSNTTSMTPGTTQTGRENMSKQATSQRREEAMRRYFGDAMDDPYFDPTSRANMSKTPAGRARLSEEDFASGRKKTATMMAHADWMASSPLSPMVQADQANMFKKDQWGGTTTQLDTDRARIRQAPGRADRAARAAFPEDYLGYDPGYEDYR